MSQSSVKIVGMDDWVDFDIAMFCIGRALGMFPNQFSDIPGGKALFWSKNPISDALGSVLGSLVEIGYIFRDDSEEKYKINAGFVLSGRSNGDRSQQPTK